MIKSAAVGACVYVFVCVCVRARLNNCFILVEESQERTSGSLCWSEAVMHRLHTADWTCCCGLLVLVKLVQ